MALQVLDYGATITLTITDGGSSVDISAATVKQFKFTKPDGVTTILKTASFTTSGTDGKLSYTIEQGVLDQPGVWKLQAIITFSNALYHSTIINLEVDADL